MVLLGGFLFGKIWWTTGEVGSGGSLVDFGFQRFKSRSQGRGWRIDMGPTPLDSWDRVYLGVFLLGLVWQVSSG